MDWLDSILYPLQWVVAWVMYLWREVFTFFGMDPHSGATWALSIVGLVIVMRIILIPLFVKQIRAARGMQMLSPELQALQKKYKGRQDPASREAMSREMMELYRKHGTNPFSSCLPILAQSPIFFALFRVLYNMPRLAQPADAENAFPRDSIGPLTRELANDFTDATLFGAPLSEWFLATELTSVRIVTAVLIVAMVATTFFTQKQLTQKNMPASALQGPMAQQQKMLLYLLPLVFLISGVNFPIGVLIYWTTTNLWSMGQQFYVIRRNPTPGSEAERRLKERRARKAAAKGIVLEEEPEPTEPEKPRGQRQQPARKDRARKRPSGTRPEGTGAGTAKNGSGEDDDARADGRKRRTDAAGATPQGGKRPAGSGERKRPSGTPGKRPSDGAPPRGGGGAPGERGGRPAASGASGSRSGEGKPKRPRPERPGQSDKPRRPRPAKDAGPGGTRSGQGRDPDATEQSDAPQQREQNDQDK